MSKKDEVRTFDTGATRDVDDDKLDYEGFFSPIVLERFAQYMHKHRFQSDGALRDSDNWQKGMPKEVYMKSAFRHFMDWWMLHRDECVVDIDGNLVDIDEAICGVLFNAMGYLRSELLGE